jgi:nucleoid DNA-binding protein
VKYPSWPSIEALLTRVDLVDAISPNRLGSDKSQWDPDVLSRSEAEEVVNVVFEAIVEALLKRETVDLPIGTFEVQMRKRPTPSGLLLQIEFMADEWMLIEVNKPAGRPERTGPPPIPRKKKIRKFKRYPRDEQLKQMLKVAKKWIVDQGILRDEVIYGLLPDAKKWVDLNRGAFRELPFRPAAILLKTRPPNFKPAGIKMLAGWADWFKSFLAHCAPQDPSLREEVVDTLIDWAKSTLPVPTGIRPWGPKRIHTFYQLPKETLHKFCIHSLID